MGCWHSEADEPEQDSRRHRTNGMWPKFFLNHSRTQNDSEQHSGEREWPMLRTRHSFASPKVTG